VAYATFGGLPGQLALIDPAKSIEENVALQMLNPSGRLSDEAEHLFDSFLEDAGVHYSIVRAIASGEQKWSLASSGNTMTSLIALLGMVAMPAKAVAQYCRAAQDTSTAVIHVVQNVVASMDIVSIVLRDLDKGGVLPLHHLRLSSFPRPAARTIRNRGGVSGGAGAQARRAQPKMSEL
jgi:hypothetical protein